MNPILHKTYRYRRLIGLLVAVLAAVALHLSASDPAFAEPCHGFAHGDPERMVLSWQVDNPLSAGFFSALTFGLWPQHGIYAIPGACTYRDYGRGLPMDYYNVIRSDAYPTFLWSRTIFGALFAYLLCTGLLRLFLSPRSLPDVAS